MTQPRAAKGTKSVAVGRMTPSGRFVRASGAAREEADTVVMPRALYDDLLDRIEDLEARRAYENTRDEESVPFDMFKRLLSGETPIRVWRQHRGLKLYELAAAIGKSSGYLSEIESGAKPGSVAVLKDIAAALRVNLDELV